MCIRDRRTLDQNTREKILKKIELICKNVAEVHDCSAEFENYNAASILQNDEELTEEVQTIAKKILGSENVITDSKPCLLYTSAKIDVTNVKIPYIFELLKKWGNLDLKEMYSTFNMGLGMVFVVKESDRDKVLDHFKDYDSIYEIGKVVDGNEIELKY